MPRVMKDYRIDGETRAALQANTGVRFLLRTKLAFESRHSSDVIPWAQDVSARSARVVALGAGHELTHLALKLNVIRLLDRRSAVFLCYDLFLHECDEDVRNQFSENTQQPIHEILKRGNTCHIIRSKHMDSLVASQYRRLQQSDKGPRPYFADSLYPPLYVDGRRIEKSKDGIPDPDEPEGWDWERGLVFAEEEDGLEGDERKADVLKEDESKGDESKGDGLERDGLKGGELQD